MGRDNFMLRDARQGASVAELPVCRVQREQQSFAYPRCSRTHFVAVSFSNLVNEKLLETGIAQDVENQLRAPAETTTGT